MTIKLPDDVLLKILEVVDVCDASSFNLVCKQFYYASKVRSIWVEKFNRVALSRGYGPASSHSTSFLRLFLTRLSRAHRACENPEPEFEFGEGPTLPAVPYKSHYRHTFGYREFGIGCPSVVQGRLLFILRNDLWLVCLDIDKKFEKIWKRKVPLESGYDGTSLIRRAVYCNEISESESGPHAQAAGVGKLTVLVWLREDQLLFVHDFEIRFLRQDGMKSEEVQMNLVGIQSRPIERAEVALEAYSAMDGPWFIQQRKNEARVIHVPTWQQFTLQPGPHPISTYRAVFAEKGRVLALCQTVKATSPVGPVPRTVLAIYELPEINRGFIPSSTPRPIHPVHSVGVIHPFRHLKYLGMTLPHTWHIFTVSNDRQYTGIYSFPTDIGRHGGTDATTPRFQPFPPSTPNVVISPPSSGSIGTLKTALLSTGVVPRRDDTQVTLFPLVQIPLRGSNYDGYGFGNPIWLQVPDIVDETIDMPFNRVYFDDSRGRVVLISFDNTFRGTVNADCVDFV